MTETKRRTKKYCFRQQHPSRGMTLDEDQKVNDVMCCSGSNASLHLSRLIKCQHFKEKLYRMNDFFM